MNLKTSYHRPWNLPPTNANPNPNPSQGAIFLRGNCLVALQTLKLTLTLTETSTLTAGQFSSGGNCPDTLGSNCSDTLYFW